MNKVSPGQNETFHIIIPQAINKSLCRQMPKVYDISGRYHSQEVKAVWQGHSLNIIKCLRDVDNLEVDLEVCSFKTLSP